MEDPFLDTLNNENEEFDEYSDEDYEWEIGIIGPEDLDEDAISFEFEDPNNPEDRITMTPVQFIDAIPCIDQVKKEIEQLLEGVVVFNLEEILDEIIDDILKKIYEGYFSVGINAIDSIQLLYTILNFRNYTLDDLSIQRRKELVEKIRNVLNQVQDRRKIAEQ